MSGRPILAGTINVSTVIRIVDSADGTPEQGVTSATTGINIWYRREGEGINNLTLSDLSALTDAHSDGGMLHIDDGYYRVDLPDDAVDAAGSSPGVLVGGTATGMVVIGTYHTLVSYDPYDGTDLGLSTLAAILALLDDPRGEPGQTAPPVNPDAMTKLDYLYKSWRNKKDNDGSNTQLYADDETTVDQKQATSVTAGTVTKGEWVSGP